MNCQNVASLDFFKHVHCFILWSKNYCNVAITDLYDHDNEYKMIFFLFRMKDVSFIA